jgi:hypothetical protein
LATTLKHSLCSCRSKNVPSRQLPAHAYPLQGLKDSTYTVALPLDEPVTLKTDITPDL